MLPLHFIFHFIISVDFIFQGILTELSLRMGHKRSAIKWIQLLLSARHLASTLNTLVCWNR